MSGARKTTLTPTQSSRDADEINFVNQTSAVQLTVLSRRNELCFAAIQRVYSLLLLVLLKLLGFLGPAA